MAKLIINPTSPSRRETQLPRSVMSIGRDPTNDLVLADAMVSRRHAVIEYRGRQYFLRDCSSSNGSLVNGDRVSERTLRDGDVVTIGSSRLLFRDDVEAFDEAGKVVQHPSSPRARCPSCQAPAVPGEVYCRGCGGRLKEAKASVVCVACGSAVALPARFCSACGVSVPEGAEPELELEPDAVAPSPSPAPAPASGAEPAAPAARAARSEPAVDRPPLPKPPVPEPRPRAATRLVPRTFGASPQRAPADWLLRMVAGLLDVVAVALMQIAILGPLAYSWWTRDLTAEVPFLPILASVALALATGALGVFYFVYFWGLRGATPGKQLLGLAIEGEDGEYPIGLPRAALRLIGYVFSAALVGVGFLMIAIDGHGLHDRIARTRVVARVGR